MKKSKKKKKYKKNSKKIVKIFGGNAEKLKTILQNYGFDLSYNEQDTNKKDFYLRSNNTYKIFKKSFQDSSPELLITILQLIKLKNNNNNNNKYNIDCSKINFFKDLHNRDNIIFFKKKFSEYIDNCPNNFNCNTIYTNIAFKLKELSGQSLKNIHCVLGTSELLYPFIANDLYTLSIPNTLYSELINRYYIYCIINILFNNPNKKIYLVLPNKQKLQKINSNENGNIRFTTKEIYTLISAAKELGILENLYLKKIYQYPGDINNIHNCFIIWWELSYIR